MEPGVNEFSPNDGVGDVVFLFFLVQGQDVLVAQELVFLDAPLAGRLVWVFLGVAHLTNIRNLLTGCHFVGKIYR